MDLTMRQVVGLLTVINKARLISYYEQTSSYATANGAKMISLDEFLQLSLKEGTTKESAFDPAEDAKLEEIAARRLQEMKAKNGRQ